MAQAGRQAELETIGIELLESRTQIAELSAQAEGYATKEAELRQLELDMEREALEQRQLEQELVRLTAEQSRVDSATSERRTQENALHSARARLKELSAEAPAAADQHATRAGLPAQRELQAGQREQ